MNSVKTCLQQIISTSVMIKVKITRPYLGWQPFVQRCELPSTPIPCCKSTVPLPQVLLPPTPTPNISLSPHFHTCDRFNQQKMMSTDWNLLISRTSSTSSDSWYERLDVIRPFLVCAKIWWQSLTFAILITIVRVNKRVNQLQLTSATKFCY